MRLLKKNEIFAKKAAEKTREVAEGLKLARKVDTLRELAAQEETNLTKFRTETVKQIHADITKESQKRDALKTEVKELESKRKALCEPLTKETHELEKKRREYEVARDTANVAIITAQRERRDVEKAVAEATKVLARAATRDEASKDALKDSLTAKKEAESARNSARDIEKKALELKTVVEKDLKRRDVECATKERELEMWQDTLEKEGAELAKEWKKLEDRKEMFERTIKRHKK